jgi:glycosyltransferase involved in cell wall biosynthesis
LIKPKKWERWQYRLINQATKTIVVTEEAKATIVAHDNTLKSKVVVVPNSIKADLFGSYKIDSDILTRFADNKVILYLGDTGLRRGLETAILGMKHITEQIPNALLVIVGRSIDDSYLKKLAIDTGVEDKVVFEGWQDLKLFPSYIKASKVAISPLKRNRHHDTTYANKIFQYMALGRPQVVSDCPAQARVIAEAKAGLVFAAEDVTAYTNAVLELLSDEELNRRMGENAKASMLKKWDWQFTSQELLNNYRELQGEIS